ncbi:MAG: hypothetical protein Q8S55_09765 [Methylococcaceae bacterium]|nr:hypothetical protein [Methylococcaceae bacterium]
MPLRDSDDALLVNWCEVTITNAKQELVYRNAWATSHAIDEYSVVQTVAAGRARWKVENENNNVLKNHGYHFDHNFAHGKQHLSNFLATLTCWLSSPIPRWNGWTILTAPSEARHLPGGLSSRTCVLCFSLSLLIAGRI